MQINFSFSGGNVDENGVIHNCIILKTGEIIGHSCYADTRSLETAAKACRDAAPVKCKMSHGPNLNQTIGTIDNFRIVGDTLRGDISILQNVPDRDYIAELASKNLGGLSLAFEPSWDENKSSGRRYVRVKQVYSIDYVDAPAHGAALYSKGNQQTSESTENNNMINRKLTASYKHIQKFSEAGVNPRAVVKNNSIHFSQSQVLQFENDGWVPGQSGSDLDNMGASIADAVNRIIAYHPDHPATSDFLNEILSNCNDFYKVAGDGPSIPKAKVNKSAVTRDPGQINDNSGRKTDIDGQSFNVKVNNSLINFSSSNLQNIKKLHKKQQFARLGINKI